MADTERFFRRLGERLRKLRRERDLSQEDMIFYGFSGRHWQQLEAGRPLTGTTMVRACEALGVSMAALVSDLDKGIYRKPATLPAKTVKDLTSKRPKKKRSS